MNAEKMLTELENKTTVELMAMFELLVTKTKAGAIRPQEVTL